MYIVAFKFCMLPIFENVKCSVCKKNQNNLDIGFDLNSRTTVERVMMPFLTLQS